VTRKPKPLYRKLPIKSVLPESCQQAYFDCNFIESALEELHRLINLTIIPMKLTTRLLMALALFVAMHRAAAQVPFTLSATLTNGTLVRSVAAADVNNDGKPDLICVRGGSSLVYVWTNSGNGFFVSNAAYTAGSSPRQVIAADVNNDGKLDLISANLSGNSVAVLTNTGNGSFALSATLPLGSSSQPRSVAAADLFGRGKPDLVSANSLLASFTVWTNAGAGNFVSNFSLSTGDPGWSVPQWAAVADLNGDGKPDLIGACNNSDIYWLHLWTNNGAGGFAPAPVPYLSSAHGFDCVVATDVNGDGRPDLILAMEQLSGGGVAVLTNNGSGGFAVSCFYSMPSSPIELTAADVDGDGQVDIVTANGVSLSTLYVLTNSGAGVFGSNATLNVSTGPYSLAAADVNGDGRVDVISGSWNSPGGMNVFTNAATFLPRLTLKRSGTNYIVSWPAIWANWTLKQRTNLVSGNWSNYSGVIGNDGITKRATNTPPAANRFFRLSNP
jgi:hypothetical protein